MAEPGRALEPAVHCPAPTPPATSTRHPAPARPPGVTGSGCAGLCREAMGGSVSQGHSSPGSGGADEADAGSPQPVWGSLLPISAGASLLQPGREHSTHPTSFLSQPHGAGGSAMSCSRSSAMVRPRLEAGGRRWLGLGALGSAKSLAPEHGTTLAGVHHPTSSSVGRGQGPPAARYLWWLRQRPGGRWRPGRARRPSAPRRRCP